jgi:YbgC/YbaW family acyl-CoA thioester hydrolase
MHLPYSIFESELDVRPDDIDMNNHVHNSKYLDYVLAARYDQMDRCYGVAMGEFLSRGLMWVVKACVVEFKRPLALGDRMIVRTGIASVGKTEARVQFEILKKSTRKLSVSGHFDYTLVKRVTGRAEKIPDDIIAKYTI